MIAECSKAGAKGNCDGKTLIKAIEPIPIKAKPTAAPVIVVKVAKTETKSLGKQSTCSGKC